MEHRYFISDKDIMTFLNVVPMGLHIHLNIVIMFLSDENLWAKYVF